MPQKCSLLLSQGNAPLHLLAGLDYDMTYPPLANLLKQTHHLEGDWLILSPIHWQATHNDAMIIAYGKTLDLTEKQSRKWFDLYAEYLSEEGLILHYYDSEHWLLRTDNKPTLTSKPVHQLLNQSLMPELALLDSSLYWQKFFTESQMFFASQPNDTLINGVWPWGGSQLTSKKQITICADDAWYALAKNSQSEVILYNASISLKDVKIILLNDINSLSHSHFEALNKQSAQWYWNNCAYTQSKRSWFARLWRIFSHDH